MKSLSNLKLQSIKVTCIVILLSFTCITACSGPSSKPSSTSDCWPNCSNSEATMRFGVIPGAFSMERYFGIKITSNSNNKLELAVLRQLAGGRPFYIHMYAAWKSGINSQLIDQINEYKNAGLLINLALRYIPPAGHNGDVVGYANWIKSSVTKLKQVSIFQITNEANVGTTTDSDGYYKNAPLALVKGIEAAATVKTKNQIIGFNWSNSPYDSQSAQFWSQLKTFGNKQLIKDTGFVGIDLYPQTYFPQLTNTGLKSLESEVTSSLKALRYKFMPLAGFTNKIPIFIQETSWPDYIPPNTNLLAANKLYSFANNIVQKILNVNAFNRSQTAQAKALSLIVKGAEQSHVNVELIQWFDLQDANNLLGDGWGLVNDNFNPKPSFYVFKSLVKNTPNG